MAGDVVLPLPVQLLAELPVCFKASFDLFLTLVVVGHGSIDLGEVQIGILLQHFLGCIPLLVQPDNVGYPDSRAIDARLAADPEEFENRMIEFMEGKRETWTPTSYDRDQRRPTKAPPFLRQRTRIKVAKRTPVFSEKLR